MDTRFGVTVSTFFDGEADVDPNGGLIGGPIVVAEAVARRLGTPEGFFEQWPDYGYDLRTRIGARVTEVGLARIRARIVEEAMKEEFVKSASVQQIKRESSSYWQVSVLLELIDGTKFESVMGVDQISVRVLEIINGRP